MQLHPRTSSAPRGSEIGQSGEPAVSFERARNHSKRSIWKQVQSIETLINRPSLTKPLKSVLRLSLRPICGLFDLNCLLTLMVVTTIEDRMAVPTIQDSVLGAATAQCKRASAWVGGLTGKRPRNWSNEASECVILKGIFGFNRAQSCEKSCNRVGMLS